MTPADQDRADRAHDKAVNELARRLQPRILPGLDPVAMARDYVNWLVDNGARWLPDTGPPPSTRPDPAAYRTGAAQARAALGRQEPWTPPPDPQ